MSVTPDLDETSQPVRPRRVHERIRIPCWTLPLHGLWTGIVMDVVIAGMMVGLFLTLFLSFSLVGAVAARGQNGQPFDVWGFLKMLSVFSGFALCFVGVAAFPVGFYLSIFKPRPRIVVGHPHNMVIQYRRKRIEFPHSECYWNHARIWSLDESGALFNWKPRIILTWKPPPDDEGRLKQVVQISLGFTPQTHCAWIEYFESVGLGRSDGRVAVAVIRHALIGGIIGLGIGLVMSESIRLFFNALIAGGIALVCALDGGVIGAIRQYARVGEIKWVRLLFQTYGKYAPLGFGLVFALLAMKIMFGMGFAVVIPVAVMNGLIGAASLYTIQREFEQRQLADASETRPVEEIGEDMAT